VNRLQLGVENDRVLSWTALRPDLQRCGFACAGGSLVLRIEQIPKLFASGVERRPGNVIGNEVVSSGQVSAGSGAVALNGEAKSGKLSRAPTTAARPIAVRTDLDHMGWRINQWAAKGRADVLARRFKSNLFHGFRVYVSGMSDRDCAPPKRGARAGVHFGS
jgi:hypothetical protein